MLQFKRKMSSGRRLLLLLAIAGLFAFAVAASPTGPHSRSSCAGAPASSFVKPGAGDDDSIDLFDEDTIAAIAESRFTAPEAIADQFAPALQTAPISGDRAPCVSRGPPSTL
jgi:hypothetical protein